MSLPEQWHHQHQLAQQQTKTPSHITPNVTTMKSTIQLTLLAAAAGLTSAIPATTTTCSTVTRTASFDDLPTGALTSYQGLSYVGWEVVSTSNTPFSSDKTKNVLRLKGNTGSIVPAQAGFKFNDQGSNAFLFGCTKGAATADCGLEKLYHAICDNPGCTPPGPRFQIFFPASQNPHSLEEVEGAEPQNTLNITWGLANPDGSAGSPGLNMFIDQYVYKLTNCGQ